MRADSSCMAPDAVLPMSTPGQATHQGDSVQGATVVAAQSITNVNSVQVAGMLLWLASYTRRVPKALDIDT